ncbi:MAG: hypothetical protein QXU18_01100 [Thermoplasmatales archaeon]
MTKILTLKVIEDAENKAKSPIQYVVNLKQPTYQNFSKIIPQKVLNLIVYTRSAEVAEPGQR